MPKGNGCNFCSYTGYIPGGIAQGKIPCPFCQPKPKGLFKFEKQTR